MPEDQQQQHPGAGSGGEEPDPMLKMLSMLMGGDPSSLGSNPPEPGTAGPDGGMGGLDSAGLPPGLAAMLGGASGPGLGFGGSQPTGQQTQRKETYLWKVIHALVALALGVYVSLSTAATSAGGGGGHVFSRERSLLPLQPSPGSSKGGTITIPNIDPPTPPATNLFLAFATAELVLQSSRYFLERQQRRRRRQKAVKGGQAGGEEGEGGDAAASGPPSLSGMVLTFLPQPYRSYVRLAGRYVGIGRTVVEDGMVIVFVVGCVAWWEGAVG